MASPNQPTLKELIIGLRRFNAWQEEQESLALPQMTVTESLNQYFELCQLVRGWRSTTELELRSMQEEKALWTELTNYYLRQSKGSPECKLNCKP